MIKRLLDIVCASLGLVVLSPVMAVVAMRIRRFDGGPALYRAPRVGLGGRSFRMFKFRTMVINADKIGGASTSNTDPRITPIGAWLRKYKLDELPQLINVWRGEMSIVGPRPEVQHYVDMFSESERAILSVRPGITDLATLWNADEGAVLAGAADPEQAYMELIRPTKIALQLRYVHTRSTWLDLWIIGRTLAGIFFRIPPPALAETRSPAPPR